MVVAVLTRRVPEHRIRARADQMQPGRTIALALAGLLFAVGWLGRRVLGALWLGIAWTLAAVVEGWIEAGKANARSSARPS